MGIAALYDEAGQYGMSHRAFIPRETSAKSAGIYPDTASKPHATRRNR